MYRVTAIVIGGLTLAACSSTPDWMNLDALKPAPAMDTVRFESEPPGAEAKTSNGQSCRTPCALALPSNTPIVVTFSLNGYQPDTENLEPISNSNGFPELRPNPMQAELMPAAPAPKPLKKPPVKKKTTAKPAAKPKSKTSGTPAAAPQAQQQAPAPWPATAPPRQ